MNFDEYRQHDALGLADLVARREMTARELLDIAMARADAVNPALNALVRRQDDAARAMAAGPLSGPFAGVPFLVKDLFQEMAGVPCSYGNRAMAAVPADQDSDVVKRWRQAGLVIFGQTNTPEFGSKNVTEPDQWGPARNPWNLGRPPGGSSGRAVGRIDHQQAAPQPCRRARRRRPARQAQHGQREQDDRVHREPAVDAVSVRHRDGVGCTRPLWAFGANTGQSCGKGRQGRWSNQTGPGRHSDL